MFMGAIVLVYDNGILNVPHHRMLKCNPPHKPFARPPPRLDPHTIVRSTEQHAPHRHILHPILVVALSQAPNAA